MIATWFFEHTRHLAEPATERKNASARRKIVLKTLLSGLLLGLLWPQVSSRAIAAGDHSITLDPSLAQHLTSLPTLQDDTRLTSTNLTNHVVVVSFFASWCPPCRIEFKHLNRLKKQLAGEPLTIVAINAFEQFDDNDAARMPLFLNDTRPEFHVVKGNNDTLVRFGNVNRIPTLFVFDQRGNRVFSFIHARGAAKTSAHSDELLAAIRPLLGSAATVPD